MAPKSEMDAERTARGRDGRAGTAVVRSTSRRHRRSVPHVGAGRSFATGYELEFATLANVIGPAATREQRTMSTFSNVEQSGCATARGGSVRKTRSSSRRQHISSGQQESDREGTGRGSKARRRGGGAPKVAAGFGWLGAALLHADGTAPGNAAGKRGGPGCRQTGVDTAVKSASHQEVPEVSARDPPAGLSAERPALHGVPA